MKSWYVVQTKPSSERQAVSELAKQFFDTFLPLGLEWRPGNKREDIEPKPLLPRYVFVSWDPGADWGPIRNTRGVSRLLTLPNGNPAAVPPGWVEGVLGRMALTGYIEIGRPDPFAPKPGDPIRIRLGHLAGYEGLCEGTQGERIKILFDGIGLKRDIWVRLDQVERNAKAL